MENVTPPAGEPGGGGSPEDHVLLPEGLEYVRSLGRGQMAHVHLARERDLGRLVAVKILRPELAADETARLRFEREARSSAALTHANVVSVHRFGRMPDDTPYLVMTYVRGRTLSDRLAASGPMGEREGRAALLQLASALAAAHKQGIVHRDLRPGNILVEEETGRVLLADFGLAAVLESGDGSGARLTRTGQILGDPRHASPEQLRGEKVTGQADIYSLAVVAYELLTGEGPFEARSSRELITAHLTKDPRPLTRIRPGLSQDLENLLLRCLSREPDRRPRARDILQQLEGSRAHTSDGLAAGSERTGPDAGLLERRVPQLVGAAVAVSLGVFSVGEFLGFSDRTRLLIFVFCAAGVAVTGILSWFHGEKGAQKAPLIEYVLVAAIVLVWLAASAWIVVSS